MNEYIRAIFVDAKNELNKITEKKQYKLLKGIDHLCCHEVMQPSEKIMDLYRQKKYSKYIGFVVIIINLILIIINQFIPESISIIISVASILPAITMYIKYSENKSNFINGIITQVLDKYRK